MTLPTCCLAHGDTLLCLRKPTGLSSRGEQAWALLNAFLIAKDLTHTGGCRAFYSPVEWEKRGELFCERALLVVVYDGAEMRRAFELAWADYKMHDLMRTVLGSGGFFFESGTNWYGGIYER